MEPRWCWAWRGGCTLRVRALAGRRADRLPAGTEQVRGHRGDPARRGGAARRVGADAGPGARRLAGRCARRVPDGQPRPGWRRAAAVRGGLPVAPPRACRHRCPGAPRHVAGRGPGGALAAGGGGHNRRGGRRAQRRRGLRLPAGRAAGPGAAVPQRRGGTGAVPEPGAGPLRRRRPQRAAPGQRALPPGSRGGGVRSVDGAAAGARHRRPPGRRARGRAAANHRPQRSAGGAAQRADHRAPGPQQLRAGAETPGPVRGAAARGAAVRRPVRGHGVRADLGRAAGAADRVGGGAVPPLVVGRNAVATGPDCCGGVARGRRAGDRRGRRRAARLGARRRGARPRPGVALPPPSLRRLVAVRRPTRGGI